MHTQNTTHTHTQWGAQREGKIALRGKEVLQNHKPLEDLSKESKVL